MKAWLTHGWTALEFVLKNFATPLAFFWMFEVHGAKPAITLAIIVTTLMLFTHWLLKLKITPFFLVASGFTVLLGSLDLLVAAPRFFRLEAFYQNFLIGVVFLVTVFMHVPIAEWFAAALPTQIRPELGVHTRGYMRGVTLAWGLYFILKSFLFLYLALKVDLGRLVLLRSVIGGISLVLMFGVELAYRRYVWQKKRQPERRAP
jgi:intracellular septation protein A